MGNGDQWIYVFLEPVVVKTLDGIQDGEEVGAFFQQPVLWAVMDDDFKCCPLQLEKGIEMDVDIWKLVALDGIETGLYRQKVPYQVM